MSTEELLKPRFKFIAPYPGSTQEVGSVTTEIATANYFRTFKANFRELYWWEERKGSDMPAYVIVDKEPKDDFEKFAEVKKIELLIEERIKKVTGWKEEAMAGYCRNEEDGVIQFQSAALNLAYDMGLSFLKELSAALQPKKDISDKELECQHQEIESADHGYYRCLLCKEYISESKWHQVYKNQASSIPIIDKGENLTRIFEVVRLRNGKGESHLTIITEEAIHESSIGSLLIIPYAEGFKDPKKVLVKIDKEGIPLRVNNKFAVVVEFIYE